MEAMHQLPPAPRPTPATARTVEERRALLLERVARHEHDPDALATVVATGLTDGFACDLDRATEHLVAIDPQPARAVQLRARTLLATMRVDDARALVAPHAAAPDAAPEVLALAARLAARAGDDDAVEAYLDRALATGDQVDALELLLERRAQTGAPGEADRELARVAVQPGVRLASRAKLAGRVLERGDVAAATEAYRRVVAASTGHADTAVASEVLGVIVDDLVAAGRADLAVELVRPAYDPDRHGATVGLSLLDAYVTIGAREEGMVLLERLSRVELVADEG